jgi:hypothetical protein
MNRLAPQETRTPHTANSPGPGKLRLKPFAQSVVVPVEQNKNPYICPELLGRLNISVVPLALDGTIPPGHEVFLKPMSMERLDELLAVMRPWDRNNDTDFGEPGDNKPWDRYSDAVFVWDSIEFFLTQSAIYPSGAIIPRFSQWKLLEYAALNILLAQRTWLT